MTTPIVEVHGLRKTYRVHERQSGLGATLRSLFNRTFKEVEAVAGIDVSIERQRGRRFPRPERGGEDDDAEDAVGFAPSERRRGEGPGVRALGAARRVLPAA